MINYFRMAKDRAKEHGVQWQLNRSYCLTCTPSHVAAQFNWHGNCATVTVDTVVFGTDDFTSLRTCVVRQLARNQLLPQDSEHASRLRTRITLTHVRSEVKSTVSAKLLAFLRSL